MSNVSERLEQQADLLFNNLTTWERNALRRIGRRIKDIKSLSHADLHAINNAAMVKQDVNAILKELAMLTEQSSIQVKKIYAEMIKKQHEENKMLYDYRGKPFIPLVDNKPMQAIVNAYARTTAGTMVNLSKTKAKRLGFVDKNYNFVSIEKSFQEVLDKAIMSVTTGTGDFNSEMRETLKELGGSGVRVDYGSGVTRRLDSMVRQNLLWGAKQASVTYNAMIGEELGCDGIEIDWHSNPRPSHEFMQGKQYALGKARIINGRLFESADDALNALNDYGCLHFKTPIICGVSEPRFSDEELARLNSENARQIDIDGVSKTGYEWKQTMRKLENEARKTKDQIELLKASGDNEGVRQLKSKLTAIEDKYNLVAKSSGIKAQPQRMAVIKTKTVDNSVKNAIIKENKMINNINVPIEQRNTGKGNPNAIMQFGRPLNNRQRKVLDSLPEYDSRVVVAKKSVNMKDLSALTAETEDEFAMFTRKNERLIIRGNNHSVKIDERAAKELAKQGYRWSGHTHPGTTYLSMEASDGDYAIWQCFKQESIVIYNSKGDYRVFMR